MKPARGRDSRPDSPILRRLQTRPTHEEVGGGDDDDGNGTMTNCLVMMKAAAVVKVEGGRDLFVAHFDRFLAHFHHVGNDVPEPNNLLLRFQVLLRGCCEHDM